MGKSNFAVNNLQRQPYLTVFIRDRCKKFKISKKKMTIGRSSKADIVIDDDRISGIHCTIQQHKNDIIIEDQESTNGSYIDGKRIKKNMVTVKSNLQLGLTVMKIEYKGESEIRFENDLFRRATTDAMTGISNRGFFLKRAREEIAFSQRTDLPIGLALLDIDHFKTVNDTFGHQAGDYIIKQLAVIIDTAKRHEDLFGRYGGEEFIILLRGKLDSAGAVLFCERIRKTIENYCFRFDKKNIPVTLSLGLCFKCGSKIESLNKMIQKADMALYRAKANGRNMVECD